MKKKLLLLGLMVAPPVADADDLRLNPEYVFSGDDVTVTIMNKKSALTACRALSRPMLL
ncbi:MAG: hypothetical protein ACI30K_07225 [Muribaculaceae bacterium]